MKEKKVPERRCIGCMSSRPKQELLRIVAGADGLKIDPSGRMPGRGAYLCKNSECVKLAVKKNAFARNLKADVSKQQAEQLAEQIAQGSW